MVSSLTGLLLGLGWPEELSGSLVSSIHSPLTWASSHHGLDGEADGIYNGFEGFGRSKDLYEIHIDLDRNTQEPQVRYSSLGKGFESKAKKEGNKVTIEFSIENRGDSTWFWQGAGREIGNAVTLRLPNKAQYTLGDGYQPTYCFMEPLQGTQTCPVTPNPPITEQEADVSIDFSKNPDVAPDPRDLTV